MSITSEISSSEFIYWPLGVKLFIWVAIFVAVIAVGWLFFWSATVDEYNQLVAREDDLKVSLTKKIKLSQGKAELKAQIPKINADFGDLLKLLPSDASVDDLIFDLNQVGASKNISIKTITGKGEERSQYFIRVPVAITFQASFVELGRFVEDLSRLPRLVTMGDFSLNRMSTEPTETRLNVSATAITYRNTQ